MTGDSIGLEKSPKNPKRASEPTQLLINAVTGGVKFYRTSLVARFNPDVTPDRVFTAFHDREAVSYGRSRELA